MDNNQPDPPYLLQEKTTHEMMPDVCACTGVISTPFSTFFEISKSSSELAMVKNSDASAK